ncbi:MAG: type 2 isopentenyl-diphosphate Delta-isomerase [Thermoplasmatota archaeon]
MTIEERKNDHIDICLRENVRTTYNHWDDVILVHQAIPMCDLEEIDISTSFLGRELSAPLMISAMTGGSSKAKEYNRLLARAAEEFGIGFGVGSQRAGLETKEHESSYSVVKEFEVPLVLGNLGAPQFSLAPGKGRSQYSIVEAKRALEMIGGDALCIHLNYLQEVVQPEGDTNAKGLLDNLKDLSKELKIVVKETGAGISRETAISLKEAHVSAIDVGGSSGTSFAAVESYRDPGGLTDSRRAGITYWDWGIPSPASLVMANVGLPMIGSGGLRNGHDVVRAISMGADLGGMAWPLLMQASKGYDALRGEISRIIEEIRIGFFLSGIGSIKDRSRSRYILTGPTREYLQGISLSI